jgi:hypothetical protein
MESSWQFEVKMKANNFFRPKMNLLKVTMKYGLFVILIRHDSAEILGFRYSLILVIGTLTIMASTGVFVLLIISPHNQA